MAGNAWFMWKSVPENVSNKSRHVIAHVQMVHLDPALAAPPQTADGSRAVQQRLGDGEVQVKATIPGA